MPTLQAGLLVEARVAVAAGRAQVVAAVRVMYVCATDGAAMTMGEFWDG